MAPKWNSSTVILSAFPAPGNSFRHASQCREHAPPLPWFLRPHAGGVGQGQAPGDSIPPRVEPGPGARRFRRDVG